VAEPQPSDDAGIAQPEPGPGPDADVAQVPGATDGADDSLDDNAIEEDSLDDDAPADEDPADGDMEVTAPPAADAAPEVDPSGSGQREGCACRAVGGQGSSSPGPAGCLLLLLGGLGLARQRRTWG
jgi:MYXO-CTERM domain-containing protein